MNKIIVTPDSGSIFQATCDGIEYEFKITSYENVSEYAKILVIDKTHNERYLSNGFIELNNHIITSKWKKEYSYERENWICTKDLIVTIQ